MIRVMLVDDHAVVRMGFRMLLNTAGIDVAAEADSGEQVCRDYPQVMPDVVVMDLSMPGMGGLEAVRRLLAHDSGCRILALSALEGTAYPQRVFKAGAKGYLSKRSAPEALIDAVRTIAAGGRYLDSQLGHRLAMDQLGGANNPVDVLTEREFSVFLQLAQGLSVAQIADNLKLAPSTVGTHLYNVKQKLAATNQAELTLVAVRWGLIET